MPGLVNTCSRLWLVLIFRVADKDWGADFRRLSAGAALVALTLWLDHMQAILLSRYLHLRFIF